MTTEGPIRSDPLKSDPLKSDPLKIDSRQWVADHIGRVLGMLLGVLAVLALAFFAALGFQPALYILVFIVAGVVLIVGGGMIHRA